MTELNFSYDGTRDQLTIEGNIFSGDFFRFFQPRSVGRAFVIDKIADGSIWIRELEFYPLEVNGRIN